MSTKEAVATTQQPQAEQQNVENSSTPNRMAMSTATSERRSSTPRPNANTNRFLIAIIVYFALLLDNVLLTVIGEF